jgi:hypothetical protein
MCSTRTLLSKKTKHQVYAIVEEDETPGVPTTTVEQLLQVVQLCDKFSKIKFKTVKLPVLVHQHKEVTCLLDSGENINCVSFELIKGERMRFLFQGYHWGQSLNRWGACSPPATINPRAQFNRFRSVVTAIIRISEGGSPG